MKEEKTTREPSLMESSVEEVHTPEAQELHEDLLDITPGAYVECGVGSTHIIVLATLYLTARGCGVPTEEWKKSVENMITSIANNPPPDDLVHPKSHAEES